MFSVIIELLSTIMFVTTITTNFLNKLFPHHIKFTLIKRRLKSFIFRIFSFILMLLMSIDIVNVSQRLQNVTKKKSESTFSLFHESIQILARINLTMCFRQKKIHANMAPINFYEIYSPRVIDGGKKCFNIETKKKCMNARNSDFRLLTKNIVHKT